MNKYTFSYEGHGFVGPLSSPSLQIARTVAQSIFTNIKGVKDFDPKKMKFLFTDTESLNRRVGG